MSRRDKGGIVIVRPDVATMKLIKMIMRANAMIERERYEYPKQKMQEMGGRNRCLPEKGHDWKM